MSSSEDNDSSTMTVSSCLTILNVDPTALAGLPSLLDQFKLIKKAYFALALTAHPDKGGDADSFRKILRAFELLRGLYESAQISSFADPSIQNAEYDGDELSEEKRGGYDDDGPVPSWEYYNAAAESEVPTYRVELAKSNRSRCKQSGNAKKCTPDTFDDDTGKRIKVAGSLIDKGELRIGSIVEETGSYGRWMHLGCWRVPSRVWLGLPDPNECTDEDKFAAALAGMNEVLFEGFADLPDDDKERIVRHVMDRDNWARFTQPKKKAIAMSEAGAPLAGGEEGQASSYSSSSSLSLEIGEASSALVATSSSSSSSSTALVSSGGAFVVPRPGVGGAKADALAGKTVVLTGLFPEVGGGTGLNQGKDRTRAMIESFGGKVTGSISGKTDILLVGKEPGAKKVEAGRAKTNVTLMGLQQLKEVIEGEKSIEDVASEGLPRIGKFSAGFPSRKQIAADPSNAITDGTEEKKSKKKSSSKKKTKKSASTKRSKATGDEGGADKENEGAQPAKKKAKTSKKSEKARKKEERRSVPVDQFDWRTALEGGELDGETVTFLKDILRHLNEPLKGKKIDLLARLRAYAAAEEDEEMEEDGEDTAVLSN